MITKKTYLAVCVCVCVTDCADVSIQAHKVTFGVITDMTF